MLYFPFSETTPVTFRAIRDLLTDWFPGALLPTQSGWYEVVLRASPTTVDMAYHDIPASPALRRWVVGTSARDGRVLDATDVLQWRGLRAPGLQVVHAFHQGRVVGVPSEIIGPLVFRLAQVSRIPSLAGGHLLIAAPPTLPADPPGPKHLPSGFLTRRRRSRTGGSTQL